MPRSIFSDLLRATAIAALLASASPAVHAETLEEALALAYATNPTLNARRASLRATDENVPQAAAGWRPTVRLSGAIGRRDVEVELNGRRVTNETRVPGSTAVTVTQPIYQGGRTIAGTQRAEAQVQAERARLLATEQTVFIGVVTNYANVLRDQAIAELRANNEQRLRRQLEATQDRFRVGEVTRTDVAQAESRVSRSNADRILAEGNLTASRAQYARFVGKAPENLAEPAASVTLPASTRDAAAAAERNNPNVMAAQFEESAQLLRIREVQGELLPDLNLVGDVTRTLDASARNQTQDAFGVQAQVSMPLYEAGSVTSRVRQARETATQRRVEIEDSRRQASADATTAFEALETAQASLKSLEQEIRAATIALEGVQQEANVGSRTVLDVLDSEQELLDAQVRQVTAKRDRLIATYQVLAAIGRLNAKDLALPIQLYDFDANYQRVRNKWWDLPNALR
ncbi:MAG: TolC family outer membrane protein [Alphaproteobacteria bacterium]|nr:TolC family outer membrane protein [Alphaproteobacteria bacterium]